MANRHCVVTGGAGFIGSELVRQLAATGSRVTVIDNLVNGKRENLADLPPRQVQLVVADIRDRRAMTEVLSGVEVLYHLACLGVRHSIQSPHRNHLVNADGTLRLLQLAWRSGVGRFVYVSSSEVYGTARQAPMTEDHPTFPTTVYGASKLAGECYARAFHRTYGYPTAIVRPFNTFGPGCHHEGDSGEVIPRFMLRCMVGRPLVIFGSGTQTRDFTEVRDTARGIMLAGMADRAVGETINLGSGREMSIAELGRRIGAVLGCPEVPVVYADPRPGDILRLCADSTRAWRLLGYAPTVGLDDGLHRLKRWYLSREQPPEVLLQQEVERNWEGEKTPASLRVE